MLARVSIYELAEGREDEAAERFGEAFAQIADLSGLVEAFFLVSREGNRAIGVTLWTDAQQMAASRVTGSRLRTEAARAVDAAVLSVDEFDVAVCERFAPRTSLAAVD